MAENSNSSLSMGPTYRRNGLTFGRIGYADTITGSSTFQIFSDEDIRDDEVINNGGERAGYVKKRVYHHLTLAELQENARLGVIIQYSVVENLCDDNFIYFIADYGKNVNKCELVCVDLATYQDKIIKTYPTGTTLNFYKNSDGTISYYGSTPELTGELKSNYYPELPLIGTHYFISGIMNGVSNTEGNLKVRSLRAIEVSGTINANFALEGQSNTIFIAGDSLDFSSFPTNKYVIDEQVTNFTRAPNTDENPSGSNAFLGVLEIKDDHSPVIRKTSSVKIDITDEAIVTPTFTGYRDWNTLARWLITGSKNGVTTSSNAIKVYDHFDSNDSQIGATAASREEWLQKRINRNPKDISAEIEWEKLGFDKTKVGPQLVTYFVTDSQSQPAVTSRWVNALGEETKTDEDNEYALDAQNFHVPLNGINASLSSPEKLKKLAKTIAWNIANNESGTGEHGNGLDEDGASDKFSTSKVEVNTEQLIAVQSATVAKPYPVDITYKPEAGVEITNRVWVFVTTDNTVADTETGIVYYADDYTIPYYSRGTHDLEAILDHGSIKAYNYYAKDTTAELTALPDKTGGSSNWSISNLTDIHDPFSGGPVNLPITVQPQLTYTWNAATDRYHTNGETTSGSLDVTLTGDVLLHVRQVIQEPSNELVVPTEGYLTVQTTVHNGGSPTIDPNYQSQVTITSGKKADDPSFTTFALSIEQLTEEDDQVNLTSIIPEFYQYNGYYVSNEKDSHGDDALNAPNNTTLTQSYLYEEGELWITLYLEPNGTNNGKPQPYSWDYKHNDLGKITE